MKTRRQIPAAEAPGGRHWAPDFDTVDRELRLDEIVARSKDLADAFEDGLSATGPLADRSFQGFDIERHIAIGVWQLDAELVRAATLVAWYQRQFERKGQFLARRALLVGAVDQ